MRMELSQRQREVLEVIKTHGAVGATIYDLQRNLSTSKATIYVHLDKLLARNLIVRNMRDNDKRVYFIINGSDGMHIFPGYGEIIPETPAAKFLAGWAEVKSINEWPFMRTMSRIPYLVAKSAEFAWRWDTDNTAIYPDPVEIAELRKALVVTMQRCSHMAKVCESILNNDTLWDRKTAGNNWYNDLQTPFSPDRAQELTKHIEELVLKFQKVE